MYYCPTTPISFAIELTYQCNNFCPGCANIFEKERQKTLANWRALFDILCPPSHRKKYAELIRLSGGEPTLHPEFEAILSHVDAFDIPHATFTNGRWARPESVIDVALACANFIGMLVSVHGSAPDAHVKFTGGEPADFDETCRNIRRAAEAGVLVFTNTVLTRYNCEQIDEVIALSQALGARHAVFNRYLGPPIPLEPTEEQLRQAVRHIETLKRNGVECRIGDCVPPCFEPNSSIGSNGGIEHCVISPDGDVRPENLTSYLFGNLFEQPLETIWQSERANWYRQQVPAACLECAELSRCRGGCRSVTVEYGLEQDRLMGEPIRDLPPDVFEFHPGWKPRPLYTLREEAFGYLLCRMNWTVPLSRDAKPLLDAFDGQHTLAEIGQAFGEDALTLVGHLYREGCLEFAE